MTSFAVPRALKRGDPVGKFDCGVPSLNNWLRTLALQNELKATSRTFVTMSSEGAIAGYYSLSSFGVAKKPAGEFGEGMPDPIPATLIGRLAVDLAFRKRGLGASLLQDAAIRAIDVSQQIGSAAIVVHATEPAAVAFYERFGFTRLPGDERTLLLPMNDAIVTISGLSEQG